MEASSNAPEISTASTAASGPIAAKRIRCRRRGARHNADRVLEGGDDCHYPSSWYSKAKKPVRPPTVTGSHAAAIGCINSALLKSSVTFDRT